ncbi:MAG: CRISPR-associated endonuclease Cas4g/Cas1g, partial [Deltaproteobacteria bacterium]
MANEAAYCPRLFYLEWVQARFEDNADTVDGRWKHRVVDRQSGAVPGPEEVTEMGAATSVLLSSEELGLIGRIDLLEGDGTSVVPVDYKRGGPPANEQRSWEPERIQLCVLGLILRDNGYECDHGVLWFAGSRERVEVPFTEELVERTGEIVRSLRRIAAADQPPPPLVDSPKCPRCSLVGVCLPDEHNALTARSDRQPRRLIPSASAARPLYVTQHGSVVGVRGGRIEVSAGDKKLASVRPIDVSQVCVLGNVQVTTQALRECFAREVPVVFMSGGGWLLGVADGLPSKHVELRMRQFLVAGRGDVTAARRFVEGKIRNCRTLLRRNGRPAPEAVLGALAVASTAAAAAGNAASLLGVEGAAARSYFGVFTTMLRPDLSLPGAPFSFAGRNRRPPRDPVNCLLSFAYALLVKDLLTVCLAVGFDPYLGLYHR